MIDINSPTDETHQYLLHAVWKVKDDHGQEKFAHRVIHTEVKGPWDPKSYVEAYIKQEHPSWMPEGIGEIGLVQGTACISHMAIFKVSGRDELAWEAWLEEAKEKRAKVDHVREREADLITIKLLQRKWRIDVEEQECPKADEG